MHTETARGLGFFLLLAQLGLSCCLERAWLWTQADVGWYDGFATLVLWSSVTSSDPLLVNEVVRIKYIISLPGTGSGDGDGEGV